MSISKDSINHLAHLSRIELKQNELEELFKQLEDIIVFIGTLNKLDVKSINPTNHILPISNVLREDTHLDSLAVDKVLDNAPRKEGNFFVVPKIIE